MRAISIGAAIASVLLLSAIPEAKAVDLINTPITNAGGNCQSARDIYDVMLRVRPLAIVNEGTAIAFATCSYQTDANAPGITQFATKIRNQTNETVSVTCTGVIGEETSAVHIVKTIILPPAAQGTMEWTAIDDNGGLLFEHPVSLSCALPPNTGLNENWATYLLQIL